MSKKSKDQMGIAHLMIVIGAVVIAVIALAAWKVTSNKSSSGTTVKSSELQSACLKEINDKNFCKFASKFTLSTSYSATIDGTDKDGKTTKMTMESDAKSNSSTVVSESGKEISAFISLDGDSYIKDETSGTWIKYAADKTKTVDNPTSDIKINTSDITEKNTVSYKFITKEKVNGLNSFKYQVVDTSAPTTTQYMWFDDKNYQMQKWYVKDDNGTTEMTFAYKSVTIKAPSPVKEFSTSAATDSTGASSADLNAALQAAQAAAAALNAGSDTSTTDSAQ